MRIARLTTFVAAAVMLAVVPVHAQGHGHASPTVTHGNPHTTTTSETQNAPTSHHTTTTTTGTTATKMNPIATKISSHPQVAAKCTSLLPHGMTLNQASSGFRNQGQFIAALHVSRNLNIPFVQLKATMLGKPAPGTSGTAGTSDTRALSLGQAIHKLRPTADADDAATRASTQAARDLSTTTPSTSTITTSHK